MLVVELGWSVGCRVRHIHSLGWSDAQFGLFVGILGFRLGCEMVVQSSALRMALLHHGGAPILLSVAIFLQISSSCWLACAVLFLALSKWLCQTSRMRLHLIRNFHLPLQR